MAIINIIIAQKPSFDYQINIKRKICTQIPDILKKNKLGDKYAIITDSNVNKIYGKKILNLFKKNGIAMEIFSFPAGEKSKNLSTVENLGKQLLEKNFHRSDCIIALGGGVVGDLAGFLASIYMRGIPFIQIPTTLLAMVDSSIGGKTGVDLPQGKNLLGAFYQPKKIYIDTVFLETLPEKEISNGLAEIIKHAIIKDKSYFDYLEKNIKKIYNPSKITKLKLNHEILNKIITRSCEIKAEVVEKDEKEKNLRRILNYGHTYGHAIEQVSNYKIPHGEAVSIGINIINDLAVKKGILNKNDASRIKNSLKKAGLPVELNKKIKFSELEKIINKDKKADGNGKISLIMIKKIGEAIVV